MQISCRRTQPAIGFLSGIKSRNSQCPFKSRFVLSSKEKDTTGFSSKYGWVHAFAHGADLLTEVVCHPDFPKNRVHEVFDILGQTI